ncbi:MAG: oligosaccharide flippase family protein [Burkholderiaceae bacterium]|nr:oligosaccharide flippase family protein [Burkholderiaceae bacterium]
MRPLNTPYWRDLGALLSGSALAQGIPILASLLLARLVLPAEFGFYAAWLGVVSVGAVFLSLRYEAALPLEPEGHGRRRALLAVLVTIVGVGGMLGLVLAAARVAGLWANVPVGFLLLGPLLAMLLAASNAVQLWLSAEGRFAVLSGYRVLQALALSGSQVLAVLWRPTAASLALGMSFGLAFALTLLWLRSRRAGASGPIATGPSVDVEFLRRRLRFVLLGLPAGVVGTVAEQLPVVWVGSRFGAEAAGFLALAQRTLGAGIGLVASSVLDVFRRDSAQAFLARGECVAAFDHAFKLLLVIASLLVLVLGGAAEWLFVLVFGEPWRSAGQIALWLLPLFALRVVASPLSFMFFLAQRQDWDLAWQLALVLFTAAALGLPAQFREALLLYAWGYAALYTVYVLMARRLSRAPSPTP